MKGPTIDRLRAEALAREHFGVEARAQVLASYADQNFLLTEPDGARWVLKVAAPGTARAELEAQNRALEHLATRGLPVPRLRAALDGQTLLPVDEASAPAGRRGWLRLVSFLEGELLVDVPHEPALCEAFGELLGKVSRALRELPGDVPGGETWNLEHALAARELAPAVRSAADRDLVLAGLDEFESRQLPFLRAQPRRTLHNDANDHNVLVRRVDPGWCVSGLLDFGDMTRAAGVCEPAIALAYLVLGKRDPWPSAAAFLRGFQRQVTLSLDERALLFPLLRTRLCVSVLRSADARARRPDDAYLGVTEPHAWEFLKRFGASEEGPVGALLQSGDGPR